ncbi:hypothetical protein AGMMS49949_00630 [Alphaproteobacteria bacterium]|nr:hypothetical protein AGMMS49949_00630 [Alphaproteobacteria bacterium]GHS95611.1 hypothetical protein AGMMS50296_0270 [Alphaproteobacteria bacterium]
MLDEFSVISQIAVVVSVALVSGLLLVRLKQPDILGYLLTGVILGPSCCAYIASRESVEIFAQLGVLMLLFVIGMDLNIKTFKKNLATPIFCVLTQIAAGLIIMILVSLFLPAWPLYFTISIGFAVALSSTAVVMNTLEQFDLTQSKMGALTVSILIAQDIMLAPMILVIKAMTNNSFNGQLIAKVVIAVAFTALFLIWIDHAAKSQKFKYIRTLLGKNKDLYMLTSLSLCFVAAALAEGIGLEASYGAFLAGLALGNLSETQDLFIETVRPIQKVLLLIFFLSIGLLLDVSFVWQHLGTVAFLLILVTIVKTLINIVILRALKIKLVQASFISVALAQLGEFTFVLTKSLEKQANESFVFAEKCLVALTVLSLILSPIWFHIAQRLSGILEKRQMNSPKVLSTYIFGNMVDSVKSPLEFVGKKCFCFCRKKKKESDLPAPTVVKSSTKGKEPVEKVPPKGEGGPDKEE